jgi:trehalose/maltose hydrolase-like predicted phosphorylase
MDNVGWMITETGFNPKKQHHHETIFTTGNGYLSTRGALEEGYPGDSRATFIHGVFDDVPIVVTEIANAPDWTEMDLVLAGERFSMAQGKILGYARSLDLRSGVLSRRLSWQSPLGKRWQLSFARFASLSDTHQMALHLEVSAAKGGGEVQVRAGLDGQPDNQGIKHWAWTAQETLEHSAWLQCSTRASKIELGMGMRLFAQSPAAITHSGWDVRAHPVLTAHTHLKEGQTASFDKLVVVYTRRDVAEPLTAVRVHLDRLKSFDWQAALTQQQKAWGEEWQRNDVVIEGDEEAQLAIRFNIFQLLIAAPRSDERVNIGAKTLSGFGYRGHSFWDTEIFMLPLFIYTRPEIARNLLSYRYHSLAGARRKAQANGFRGAQYPWESAGSGDEVTPTWVPHFADRNKMVRIWTGDIEVHISADVTFAILQYWHATGDDEFLRQRGAEIILDTARFWGSRVEWVAELDRYEVSDIIGPDEYHDHVDNNAFTNYLIRWHLQQAQQVLGWLEKVAPPEAARLKTELNLDAAELQRWQHVIEHIYCPYNPQTKLIEQFEGYFKCRDVDLETLEPRSKSVQELFGIEGAAETQVLKQPDVLMLLYLLPELYGEDVLRANYAYYTPRTDHTYGSSLGPSIQAIMACRMGDVQDAYTHCMRAASADLLDVRGNAGDGIHGASAGGMWQAVVFGFAGLKLNADGSHNLTPHLPKGWKRVAFQVVWHGKTIQVDVKGQA